MDSTPAYSGPAATQDRLPAYVDSPFLPPPTDDKHKHTHAAPAPQSVWIQDSDLSGFSYRRRHILPADDAEATPAPPQPPVFDAAHSPPTYTAAPAPLYTVKIHGQHSPLEALLSSPPDFTIYIGDGDAGAVVATGTLHTSPLKKSLGELRFFPRASTSQPAESSSSSSPAAREIPAITLKERDDAKKYVFSTASHDFEWCETGPGERPPPAAAAEEAAEAAAEKEGGEGSADGKGKGKGKATAAPGFFAKKLKRKSSSAKPSPRLAPRDTKTWELTARDGKTATTTLLATYTELQPDSSTTHAYSATAPKYRDGHTARLDVHAPAFGVAGERGATEFAVASIMLLVEAQRKKILNARSRGWLDGIAYGNGSGGGCGGT